MKRYGNIFAKIYDFGNLYEAYMSARRNKAGRQEILAFSRNLEENLIDLQNKLLWHEYHVGKYREFYVTDPKRRLVMALPFRDRVVQWAIYRQINWILDKRYINTSYACRCGGGTQKAVKKLQQYIRHTQGKVFVLKLDVAKYFYRIDQNKLIEILQRIFKDKELISLLREIIRGSDVCNPFGINLETGEREFGVGIPIGNLTSQMFANLYLNEVDQYAKHVLKARKYIRFMDDITIVSDSKEELREDWNAINEFLCRELHLSLNRKSTILRAKDGVDFCGYRIWGDHIKIRKKTAMKMRKRLRYLQKSFSRGEIDVEQFMSSIKSYFGLLKHCDGYNLQSSIIERFYLQRGAF